MEDLFANGQDVLLVRGDVVDLNNRVFYIDSGAVGVFSVDDKQRYFLYGFKSGEYFGNLFNKKLFLSGRKLEYRALSNCMLKRIPKQSFMEKALSSKYKDEFVFTLLNHISFLIERIDNLGQGHVQQRLVERLIFFAERLGEPRGKKIIISAPMSHMDIATSINSTRETINRLMKQLEREGYITVRKQTIVINSLDGLIKIANGKQKTNYRDTALVAGLTVVGLEASLAALQQITQ